MLLKLYTVFLIFYTCKCSNVYIEKSSENVNLSNWEELSDARMNGMSKASLVLQDTPQFRRIVLFTLLNPLHCGAALAGYYRNVTLDASNYFKIAMQCRGQGQHLGYKFVIRHKGQVGEYQNQPAYVHLFQESVKLLVEGSPFLALMGDDMKYTVWNTTQYLTTTLQVSWTVFEDFPFLTSTLPIAIMNTEHLDYYKNLLMAPLQFATISLNLNKFQPYYRGLPVPDAEPLDKSAITSIGILAYGGLHNSEKQNGVASLEIDWIKLE